ncbi:MAG TPA: hypothetical protein VK131_00390, partial [Candidatus Acidoferrales bacterium]|nr:hypothetical protein [Candidatus Acidoferrales bacterium]
MTPPRFEQFYALRRIHGQLSNLAFSPDGRELAYTHDGSGQFNLWRQGVRGGYPAQLTSLEEEAVRFQVWTRHGFILAIDPHGDEQMQLHRLGLEGGWPEDLTRRTDCQYLISPGNLDPGGDRLAFAGNAIRPADVSIFELHIPTGQVRTLLDAEGRLFPRGWHPDGRRLLVEELIGNPHQEVFLYDPATGERRYYTSQKEEQLNRALGFDKS